MLCWDISDRYTIQQILDDTYLKDIRNLDEEPSREESFDFSFEWKARTINDMKLLLHEEVETFKQRKKMVVPKYYGS
ncbi:Sporulation-specific mitogen-activated protein kinase SMK1 [Pichia kudriavzevii]|nr:Sporulation-specific mitogen-activated protein kinase SMK1 [Pichia kudriavzevii]